MGLAAAIVAAGIGATPPREVHVNQVVRLEATLAASVTDAVAATTTSNTVAPEVIPTASAAATPGGRLDLPRALVFTASAVLLTPAWYIGFPVTIAMSSAFSFLFIATFVAGSGGIVGLAMVPVAIAMGVAIYAVLPPAAILGGLDNIWAGLFPKAAAQPVAGARAKTVAAESKSDDTPASTGHSGRDVVRTGPPVATAAPTRTRPAAAAQSGSSKKSTTSQKASDGPKRTVGSSGRNR